jgi:hypothetical protein
MKSLSQFTRALVALAVWLALAAAASTPTPVHNADKLVILSTTDVKGKTSPCG